MLDIKLKNKHALGVVLIFLVIAGTALAALGFYPYMQKKSDSYRGWHSQWQDDSVVDNMAIQLMNCTYSIWMEVKQQEAGHLLTPTQVFLPDLKEQQEKVQRRELEAFTNDEEEVDFDYSWDYSSSYYRDIQTFMDSRGQIWKSNYRNMASQIDYQMTDWEGKQFAGRTEFITGKSVYAELRFDSTGYMVVGWGNDEGLSEQSQRLANALNYYVDHDPVRQDYGDQYLYSGIQFERPKDVVFRFWVPEELLSTTSIENSSVSASMLQYSGVVTGVGMALILLVSVAALLLPCFKTLQVGQGKIFRAPFEVVSFVAIMGLVTIVEAYLPAAMVAGTLNGYIASEIQEMGAAAADAQDIVWVINWFVWAIGFALVYWIITCYRAVFTLGLWRYIKERTLFGRFCCWIKRCWERFVTELGNIDLREGPDKTILKMIAVNFVAVALICCFWFIGVGVLIIYSAFLFFIIKKYWVNMQKKYELLLDALREVANGNLDIEIEENLGVFEPFRAELSTIQDGLKQAVNKAVKSQRMKTELITNVSHDLKTPLTAIITYVNLLKDESISEEERKSYIDVLEQKSMRLKVLIEDLFEVSKANSNNITLHPEAVDIVNLMKQIRLELSDRILQSSIDFRWDLPEEKVTLMLDGQKTYRIFENLLVNIIKYALPGTRAYIELKEHEGEVIVSMRNISANELQVSGQELTGRFVRGDESRNTEGSGLGLAIAKSFTEVQGGRFIAEAEADLFRVIIIWPAD